jgi:hypothetical protein
MVESFVVALYSYVFWDAGALYHGNSMPTESGRMHNLHMYTILAKSKCTLELLSRTSGSTRKEFVLLREVLGF